MAWCRPGSKPLSEPVMVSLLTHICVTRSQCVITLRPEQIWLLKEDILKTFSSEDFFYVLIKTSIITPLGDGVNSVMSRNASIYLTHSLPDGSTLYSVIYYTQLLDKQTLKIPPNQRYQFPSTDGLRVFFSEHIKFNMSGMGWGVIYHSSQTTITLRWFIINQLGG